MHSLETLHLEIYQSSSLCSMIGISKFGAVFSSLSKFKDFQFGTWPRSHRKRSSKTEGPWRLWNAVNWIGYLHQVSCSRPYQCWRRRLIVLKLWHFHEVHIISSNKRFLCASIMQLFNFVHACSLHKTWLTPWSPFKILKNICVSFFFYEKWSLLSVPDVTLLWWLVAWYDTKKKEYLSMIGTYSVCRHERFWCRSRAIWSTVNRHHPLNRADSPPP